VTRCVGPTGRSRHPQPTIMKTDTPISNVVLVTVDSLRADAIGAYDEDRHTPVMDDLAADGTVFERAFATGNWTPFSFPSILASRPVFADTGEIGVENGPTLARTLSDSGVATGGFNAANGFLTSHWGYDDGFDAFEPFVASVGSSIYSRYLATHPTVEAWLQLAASPVRRIRSKLAGNTDDRPFLDTSRMFDVENAATDFLDDAEEPFFLWLHYMDTHTPYVPAPRYIREVSDGILGTHRMLHAHTRTGLGWDVDDRTLRELRTLYRAATRQESAGLMVMPFVKGPRLRSLFRPFTIAYAHELPCPLLVTKSTHPYERILVPFDGTPIAELALELGVDLAGQLNAEVVVAVVREPAFLGGEETRDEWVEELLKKARELGRIHKIQILEKVLEGNPVREITAFAKEFNLLIMASANPKKAFFTPHVGEHLVEEAPCSVLIVTH